MAKLFFSYSRKDEDLRDQLEVHLAALKRQGVLDTWHDRRIVSGEEFAKKIDENIKDSDVILLLVSPDFIASDYCCEVEVKCAMELHHAEEAIVIPVILRPCKWKKMPFGELNAPLSGQAVVSMPDIDAAFLEIVNAIEDALKIRNNEPSVSRSSPKIHAFLPTATQQEASISSPRSSNLRVSKEFTDREKDAFLHDSFAYMKRFFESSLCELKERHSHISGTFREVDSNRFTVVIYKNDSEASSGEIWIGGRFSFATRSINYGSMSHMGGSSSISQSVSVDSDSQSLYFVSPFSIGYQNSDRRKLSQQGAAELFWSHLMDPLQY